MSKSTCLMMTLASRASSIAWDFMTSDNHAGRYVLIEHRLERRSEEFLYGWPIRRDPLAYERDAEGQFAHGEKAPNRTMSKRREARRRPDAARGFPGLP